MTKNQLRIAAAQRANLILEAQHIASTGFAPVETVDSNITETEDNDNCAGCGKEPTTAIDNWITKDGKRYCKDCQKEENIGWYHKEKED